jgi:hypothetical protein
MKYFFTLLIGILSISVLIAQPANNIPCDADTLNPNQLVMGTTENAQQTFGNVGTLPCPQSSTSDVWYTFTVNNSQDKIELEIIGGSVGNQIQALLGQFNNGCQGVFTWQTPVAFCGVPNSTITYKCLEPGEYYVMISTSQANQGTFNLRLTRTLPSPNCGLNDDCNAPISLPALVLNQPISNACIAGCNIGACGEPFNFQGCNYNGAVVWYSVTVPTGTAFLNINVTGTGPTPLENPFIQVFNGLCGNGLITDCQVGGNGTVAFIGIENIIGDNTYYIAVGNYSGEPGHFNICVSATDPPTSCLTGATANVPPGPFCPDEEIDISYTLNYTSAGNNCQWPHAVIPIFGDCYIIDETNMPSFGNWVWFPAGAVTHNLLNTAINIYDTDNGSKLCYPLLDPNCTGSPLMEGTGMPAGWYWINQVGNCGNTNLGDPNNTWGMPCGGCGGTCSATFNFRIKTKDVDECEVDPNVIDCGIQFYVFSDRQTGCWTQGGANTCGADFPLYINRYLNCVRPPDVEPATASICSGDAFFIQLSSTPMVPGIEYEWTIGETNGVLGASAGAGRNINQILTNPTNKAQTVIYLVTTVDQSECYNGNPTEIPVTVLPEINVTMVIDSVVGIDCANKEFGIDANATGGEGNFSFSWSHDPQETGNSINVLSGSQTDFLYTVTVTDGNGCTKSETVTFSVNPEIFVEFVIDTTEFCESEGPKQLTLSTTAAIAEADWSGPPGYFLGFNNNIATISLEQHSGSYSVTITDIFGCQGTADTIITVYANPRIIGAGNQSSYTFYMDENADDEFFISFNIEGTGGETQYWNSSVPGANEYINSNTGVFYIRDLFNNVGPGTYDFNVVVTDFVGCSTERSWEVILIDPAETIAVRLGKKVGIAGSLIQVPLLIESNLPSAIAGEFYINVSDRTKANPIRVIDGKLSLQNSPNLTENPFVLVLQGLSAPDLIKGDTLCWIEFMLLGEAGDTVSINFERSESNLLFDLQADTYHPFLIDGCINIEEEGQNIAGVVTLWESAKRGIRDVNISLLSDQNLILEATTDVEGSFNLPNVVIGNQPYEIRLEKEIKESIVQLAPAVQAANIIRQINTRAHFLSLRQYIGGDYDCDRIIDVRDAVRLMLESTSGDTLANNLCGSQRWFFIRQKDDPGSVGHEDWYLKYEAISRPMLEADYDLGDMDFYGIRKGDVINLVNPSRGSQELYMLAKDTLLETGIHEIPVLSYNFNKISSFGFGLRYLESKGRLLGLNENSLFGSSLFVDTENLCNGCMSVSWVDFEGNGYDHGDNKRLITMRLEVKEPILLSEFLRFDEDIYPPLGTNGDLDLVRIKFTLDEADIILSESSQVNVGYNLYQNRPNPFTGETVIGYSTPKPGKVELIVFDQLGKMVLRKQENTMQRGYHEMKIQMNNVTGLLYYQLRCEGFTATKKMISVGN